MTLLTIHIATLFKSTFSTVDDGWKNGHSNRGNEIQFNSLLHVTKQIHDEKLVIGIHVTPFKSTAKSEGLCHNITLYNQIYNTLQ